MSGVYAAGAREAAAAARHDLGKYICFNLRFAGPSASDAELLEALRADLLSTRSGPQGDVDALAVWAGLAPGLAPLRPDPDLDAVDAALAELTPQLDALRAGALDRPDLEALALCARRVQAALNRLHSRLKEP